MHFITFIVVMKRLLSFLFFSALFFSCSLQKRHYRKGFYLEKNSYVAEKTSRDLFRKKIIYRTTETIFQVTGPGEITAKSNTAGNNTHPIQQLSSIPKSTKHFYSLLPLNQKTKHESDEKPDPSLNKVAKTGFRISIYSMLFMAGALILFNESVLFYIVLGLFILAFIFALVALLTSISANKDKFNTDRKGHRFSRFGFILSLLIIAAIATFFIFTPTTF
jgi:hypothetical protein